MVNTVIGETLTVKELIEKLKEYPEDTPVCDYGFDGFVNVKLSTWEHNNHPYNLPDTDFVMIL